MKLNITGVRLSRSLKETFVSIEVDGKWTELIREPVEAMYDHIVNDSGIAKAISMARPDLLSETDKTVAKAQSDMFPK